MDKRVIVLAMFWQSRKMKGPRVVSTSTASWSLAYRHLSWTGQRAIPFCSRFANISSILKLQLRRWLVAGTLYSVRDLLLETLQAVDSNVSVKQFWIRKWLVWKTFPKFISKIEIVRLRAVVKPDSSLSTRVLSFRFDVCQNATLVYVR